MDIHRYIPVLVVAALAAPGPAGAVTSSVAQLSVEGNATCSSLSVNSILQAKDTSIPAAGATDTLTGPDGQRFSYRVDAAQPNKIADWHVVTPDPAGGTAKPASFVILKGSGSAGGRAFYFGNSGSYGDADESVPGAASIAAISICYGLAAPFVPPVPPAPALLPACDPTLCPAPGTGGIQARIVTQFDEPDDATTNWQVESCQCDVGTPAFTECNPELPAGPKPSPAPGATPGPCTSELGHLIGLPIEVQLARDPDSYYCTIIGGIRKCYRK